ncbi:MAG: terpene synthase family protein [Chloroflexi bacterium]|nr:terpene synthase family protein [Chloroflexota bacterium]
MPALTPQPDRPPRGLEPPTSAAKDSPWAGLRSRFLASLEPADQARIFDLSTRTARTLHGWAAGYPLIRRERVGPLALSVAAAAPFAPVDALISTARLSLWVFTLDDLFDEERPPQVELMARAARYRALAYNQIPCPAGDGLGRALFELREDLAGYRLFASLGGVWANALSGTIDGMIREYEWRLAGDTGFAGPAALPTYAEYLATGRYSIGGPPHIWAALITTDDPSTPAHLDHLGAMEKLASTCIRLANDVRSYRKEIDEGNINALVILSRALCAQGASPEAAYVQAEARVYADIAVGLTQLAELRESAVTDTGRPEAAIDNIARFVCDFYTHHDYHTFLAAAA